MAVQHKALVIEGKTLEEEATEEETNEEKVIQDKWVLKETSVSAVVAYW